MSGYVVYNTGTGIISRVIQCQPSDVAANLGSGEAYLDYIDGVDDSQHIVDVTVTPNVITTKPAPDAATQLAQAKASKVSALTMAYNAAIMAPVSFTNAAGTTASFNQQPSDIANLQKAILGSEESGTWSLNLWQDHTGAVVTPFTFADLKGLAAAFESADVPDYTHLLTLLAEVNAATDLATVAAITW